MKKTMMIKRAIRQKTTVFPLALKNSSIKSNITAQI
nr:MAG TPA: hypothetical protein [Caudoviricetes sp.]